MPKNAHTPRVIDAPVRVPLDQISAIIERSPRPAAPLARYQAEASKEAVFEEARRTARQIGEDPAGSLDAQANVMRTRLARLHKDG